MTDGSRFWDGVAERYAKRPVPDEETYRRKLDLAREVLTPDSEVLELGCGTGSTAIALAPHAKRILAADYSAKMLEIAREKARAAGVQNVEFQQAGVDDLDLPDASVDAVLAMNLLHLLDDRDAALATVFRLLKPGGAFVSGTACLGDMSVLIRAILPLARAVGMAPPVRIFTADALAASVASAGFGIVHDWRPGRNKAVFIVARKPG